ncbi:Retinal dehydrogenase 1 [Trichoderma lentiforme]|uniref:aldehyde dehydrogenase (NAD(+)) n=1 Tax=Trichoderma lentiforme TaxID=1567552 RepID=A0A9P5CDU3_9HYPO|nr:Retinal dehydrogenase 1 [Trichoderma lentiforme]
MALLGQSIPISFSKTSFNKLYVNGKYIKSNSTDTLSLLNPKDGTLVAEKIPIADKVDVDTAVKHAEAAFNGPWATFTSSQRSECFRRLADILETKLPDILHLDSLTTGNPVSLIPTREKNYIKNCLLYYAGWTDKLRGDYFPADDGFVKLVRQEPLGVCVAINPYNSPVASLFIKAAPCLATGNVLIVKPSEKSPLGSLAVAPLFEEAGFPPGVVQVLPGDGKTGALLAEHMRVRKISFTGSVATGKKIQIAAAQSNLKRVTLELGGKSPAVIFEDADIDNAVTWTINGILARTGQVCVAASRVYVQKSISEKFISQYVERMKAAALGIGDPQDPDTRYGPLADSAAFEKVRAMISRGKGEAELVVGGNQIGTKGCFIEPTVFLNPKPDAEIYRNEVFGPVVVVKTFDTEEEVIEAANDTEYGLMAGVFTKDINRALRVSARIDSGVVGVNCVSMMHIQAPFGGKKASGIGREFGEYALRAFTEPKTILINMNSS